MTPSELDLAAIAQVASILQSEGVRREAALWEASRMCEEGRMPGTTTWGMHLVRRRPVLVQAQGRLAVAR